jgi:SAM-dependent methyltransferase
VDLSGAQLALARRNAPAAALLQADMTRLHLLPASLDAVGAFYSLTHVPREQLGIVLGRVAEWLRPGGIFVATMGAGDSPAYVNEDWMGVPMFFSHFDSHTNLRLVIDAGFRIEEEAVVPEVEHDGREAAFLWVVARKSTTRDSHMRWPGGTLRGRRSGLDG